MPELQQPDIVGNFLSSYATAQAQQQAQKDRAFQQQRVMRQDDMAEQQFGMQQQAHQLKLAEEVTNMLGSVQDGDAAGFERAKQRWGQMGLPPEAVAGYTVADLPALRIKAGTQLRELQAKAQEANIRQSNAAAAASNALTRQRQAQASPTQYANISVGGASTVAAPNPYANLSDDAARNRFYLQEAKANEKIRADARAAAAAAQNKLSKVEQFRKMNKETGTGGVYSGPILPGLFQSFARATDSNFTNMEAITAELAPQNRAPGSGATSDYDAKQFERATVSVEKPGPANKNIAIAIAEQAKRDIGYSKFVDWYFQTHKTNQGMDQAWQEYVDSNPIFDPQSPDTFDVNKGSVGWDKWFGVNRGQGSAQAKPTAPKKKTILPNGVTIEELD